MECSISNRFSPSSQQCDCAVKSGLDKKDPASPFIPKPHVHFHPDEYYPVPLLAEYNFTVAISSRLNFSGNMSQEQDGFIADPFHPPAS
jgi:hypothetical protein